MTESVRQLHYDPVGTALLHGRERKMWNNTLQPTNYPCECLTFNEDGMVPDCSKPLEEARTLLYSAFYSQIEPRAKTGYSL